MAFLSLKHGEGRLIVPIDIDGKILRRENGSVTICVFLYQMQQEIPVGVRTTAGVDAAILRDHYAIDQLYMRKECAELIIKNPVGGAFFAIEQTCGCKQKRT